MRILFLSFYYAPDLCAGSFRSSALIKALQALLPIGSRIDVLTTMPNRYSSFSVTALEQEFEEIVSIHRIPIPPHNSGMLDQAKAFFAYAHGVRSHVQKREYDLIVATSSRLMTAVLGAFVARRQNVQLYLDIRDIFADTITYILPRWIACPIGTVFSFLERYAIGNAKSVNLVSRGFEAYFKQRYPKQRFVYFSNGIDDEFIPPSSSVASRAKAKSPYLVLYAGNLGEGQGLHAIIPSLAKAMHGKLKFRVIGDGGRKRHLKKALEEVGVENVSLEDPVNRKALVDYYQAADVLFLHLNNYDAFKKVLPSKIFEYASTGKPIWAGVAGYAADFVAQEIENAEVFLPGDVGSAIQAFAKLQIQHTPRTDFVRKYQRCAIMQALASDIVSIGLERRR